ncbi:uncharacterized protein LOC113214306 isoform X1 [Frankliniella occidentalis]|uniref:Uncharacterized protein LOC113214306 isoform X1 n=1 Tax=Frankliniella occidentalis TaxID=133901 RepID=A0A6J1T801_FRAOC|nr:uncharacterized protein LOC113214306 isoform X1 [Frankliniella occidentalis]
MGSTVPCGHEGYVCLGCVPSGLSGGAGTAPCPRVHAALSEEHPWNASSVLAARLDAMATRGTSRRSLRPAWLTVFLPSVMMALTLTLLALQATGAPASAKKEKDSLLDDVLEARKFDLVGKVKDFLGFGSSSKASSPQPKRPASPKPESDGWIRVEPPPL